MSCLQISTRPSGSFKACEYTTGYVSPPGPSDHLGKSEEQTQEAIEHMCFLVDVQKVYDCALGMYDLELALLVAQESKMVGTT
jgi:hypothetical protein